MAGSDVLTCKCDEDLRERVDDYAEAAGYPSRSQALEQLIQTGLREEESPLGARARDQAVQWAGLLTIGALVLAVVGVASPVPMRWAWPTTLALVGASAVILGVLEFARLVAGQSQLGQQVRRVVNE